MHMCVGVYVMEVRVYMFIRVRQIGSPKSIQNKKDINFFCIEALISLHKYIAYGIKGCKELNLYFYRSVCIYFSGHI